MKLKSLPFGAGHDTESLHQLRVQQPPFKSEAEVTDGIHILNSNSQDVSVTTTLTGIIPSFKPTSKKVFYPKTSTVSASLAIYKTAMRRAHDEIKQEHILTCLHLIYQEVVVPKLANITYWSQKKETLIVKFGGDLIL
ncbi:hypothetical protein DSO57_1018048 [Entomophthora muscae]|uniref:Uncharacterized protein n=1 Tax=Entomophthora muscae TaxID=34485 RepID=A0ACC2UQ21_9FUNG|nr:hypothetical protein DSO57_1018048 [Entomophthora muscae]